MPRLPHTRQVTSPNRLLRRVLLGSALLPLPLAALADAPRVLVDTPALHGIATSVMAGAGTPDLLLPPGASPHDFALRPSDASALSEAEVIFWVGAGLTPWLADPLATLGGNATRVALLDSAGWPSLALRDWEDGHDHGAETAMAASDDHAHDEAHDEAHEDDHDDHAQGEAHADEADHGHDHGASGGIDPHAWLDPTVASAWALTMADTLADLDPDNAALYRQNAAALTEANAALIRDLTAQLAPLAGQAFIVPHDAFQYFEARFGLPASGTISLSDAQMPTPAALAALRDRTEAEGIGCILTDPQTDAGWAQVVAEGSGARLVAIDAEGTTLTPGADLYGQLLRNLADALETCLSPA